MNKNILESKLINDEQWDEYQSLKAENDRLFSIIEDFENMMKDNIDLCNRNIVLCKKFLPDYENEGVKIVKTITEEYLKYIEELKRGN